MLNNREVLFQKLIAGLDELLKLNEIEVTIDIESYAAGFQGVAAYVLDLIQSKEDEGSSPREIIDEIKNTLDNGSHQIIN